MACCTIYTGAIELVCWCGRACACSSTIAGCMTWGTQCSDIVSRSIRWNGLSCEPTSWMPAWKTYHNAGKRTDVPQCVFACECWASLAVWIACHTYYKHTAFLRCGSSCAAPTGLIAHTLGDILSTGTMRFPNAAAYAPPANWTIWIVCRIRCTGMGRRRCANAYAGSNSTNSRILYRRHRTDAVCALHAIACAPSSSTIGWRPWSKSCIYKVFPHYGCVSACSSFQCVWIVWGKFYTGMACSGYGIERVWPSHRRRWMIYRIEYIGKRMSRVQVVHLCQVEALVDVLCPVLELK